MATEVLSPVAALKPLLVCGEELSFQLH